MKKIVLAAVLALSGAVVAGPVNALPFNGLKTPLTAGDIQQVQFYFGGRNYCWYDAGWHGPGFYWCGYAFRRGLGWGGAYGWRGWRPHRHGYVGPRHGYVGPRHGYVGPRHGARGHVGARPNRGGQRPAVRSGGGRGGQSVGRGGGRGGGGGHRR